MKGKPRYTKDGVIYKADREYLAKGWPEMVAPGTKPVRAAAAESAPDAGAVKKGKGGLALPDPMKRKGKI